MVRWSHGHGGRRRVGPALQGVLQATFRGQGEVHGQIQMLGWTGSFQGMDGTLSSEPDPCRQLDTARWTVSQHLRKLSESVLRVGLAMHRPGGAPQTQLRAGPRKAGVLRVHLLGACVPLPVPYPYPPSQLPVSVLGPQKLPLLIMVQNGMLVSVGGPEEDWSAQPSPAQEIAREGG